MWKRATEISDKSGCFGLIFRLAIGVKDNSMTEQQAHSAATQEYKMSYLSKLKIVAQQQKRLQSKTEHRRAKLLEKLDDQLAMVQALVAGELFTRHRRVWQTNDEGDRVLVERVKRTRPWYWMSGAGGCYFSIWYGSKVLELKPGMTAIAVNKREDLPDAIKSIIEAVKFGELDIQIEDVAEKGTAELRLKGAGKEMKRAG